VRGEAAAAPVAPLTQQRLAELRAGVQAPALAAAAEQRDGASLSLADGVRAMRRQEAVTASDRWHVGSITKSMTATLVARCAEAGLVSWDDTVAGVLGAVVPELRSEYRDVTLRHLLSHRAGLQANIPLADFTRYRRENPDPRDERIAFARQALAQAPNGPKETSFLYSNNGYVIAGAMLEAKLGAPWETLIRTHVFEPFGMTSAGFGAPGTPQEFDQPVGHAAGLLGLRAFPPGEPITDNPAVAGPAGRVHLSFADMLKYLGAHRDRSNLLNAESWRTLHTPPFGGDYAMGWVVRGDARWHNGSNTLWYAEVLFDSVRGVAGVAATNDGRAQATSAVGAALQGALMMDFENVVRPPDMSFIAKLDNWVTWLEHGGFDPDRRRRKFLAKRVYWNSHCEGNRPIFERRGFDAFACPSAVKDKRSAADIWIALDAIDLTIDFRNLEEVIIISTDTDFVPVVNRLREKGKAVVVVVNEDNLSSNVYPLHADTVIYLKDLRAATLYDPPKRGWFARSTNASPAPTPVPAAATPAPQVEVSKPAPAEKSKPSPLAPTFDLQAAAVLVLNAARVQPGLFISRKTVCNVLRGVSGFSTIGKQQWLGCGDYCTMLKAFASQRRELEVAQYKDGGCAIRLRR
jgi:CubicO group peptidase (beta-lactamase class C family)